MPDTVLTTNDAMLNDYLFDALSLDQRIQVEKTLAANPELAARVASYRARILALKLLAERTLEQEIPAALADILAPLVDQQASTIQPGRMADWLANGGYNGIASGHHAAASRHGVVADRQTHDDTSPAGSSRGNGRIRP